MKQAPASQPHPPAGNRLDISHVPAPPWMLWAGQSQVCPEGTPCVWTITSTRQLQRDCESLQLCLLIYLYSLWIPRTGLAFLSTGLITPLHIEQLLGQANEHLYSCIASQYFSHHGQQRG